MATATQLSVASAVLKDGGSKACTGRAKGACTVPDHMPASLQRASPLTISKSRANAETQALPDLLNRQGRRPSGLPRGFTITGVGGIGDNRLE
eukprot:CAMPEP_0180765382 /NCGR_PEP_ID=MMETSP1038_2-20121128/38945_1 /TAXON_ID=632150 /ORGANISM="Azadinium spinosum, Strain 3D9" /LENGTH=92 /DNA_ID=CAMNT_0022799849 /DNA_START=5 /DNA_END=283 /DNA_ORIENTATION=-